MDAAEAIDRWHDDGGACPPALAPAGGPTAADLARDLAADLAYCLQFEATARADSPPWKRGWPSALRRALAAEAEVLRLRAQVEGHAARIAAQAELLARRAEKGAAP